ncbi:MAG: ATP-binding cassette domain-containing protein, partial [Nitrospinota bacterium]
MAEKLVLQDVTKSYGDFAAVKGISFAMAEGECVALLGPSGCGKTTTLRCIAGLERPDGGEILFDGQP